MALNYVDLVKETCASAPGTGAFTLNGSVIATSFQGFNATLSDGEEVYYTARIIVDGAVTAQETGKGTWTAGTTSLSRDTIAFSTNGGSAVNFTTAPEVYITVAAEFFLTPVTTITDIDASIRSGDDATLITGTAGSDTEVAYWNADGDLESSAQLILNPTLNRFDFGDGASSLVRWTFTDTDPSLTYMYTDIPNHTTELLSYDRATFTLSVLASTFTFAVTGFDGPLAAGIVDDIGEIDASIRSGDDATLITGTTGSNTEVAYWNADGDLVSSSNFTHTDAVTQLSSTDPGFKILVVENTNNANTYLQLRSSTTAALYFQSSALSTVGNLLWDGTNIVLGHGVGTAITVDSSQNVTLAQPLFMAEQAAAGSDVAGYGQLWVKDDTPNTLWFTDDAGTDVQLGVGGDVSAVPTPVDGQIAIWASGTTIEGDAALTFDTTNDALIVGDATDGVITAQAGTDGADLRIYGGDGSVTDGDVILGHNGTGVVGGVGVGGISIAGQALAVHGNLYMPLGHINIDSGAGAFMYLSRGSTLSDSILYFRTGGVNKSWVGMLDTTDDLTIHSDSLIQTTTTVVMQDSATVPPWNMTERAAAPSAPVAGDIYLDDGTSTGSGNPGFRRYTGAVWEDVSAGAGGGASQLSDLSDVNTSTPTSGNVLVADGVDFESVPLEGTQIASTGEAGANKFLREDGDGTCSWQTPAGGGNVSNTGTPLDNQVAVWTNATTIEGNANLTFDGSTLTTLVITASVLQSPVSTDLQLYASFSTRGRIDLLNAASGDQVKIITNNTDAIVVDSDQNATFTQQLTAPILNTPITYGLALDKGDPSIVDSTGLKFEIEKEGTGDMRFIVNGVLSTLDCTTGSGTGGKARVALTAGADAQNPQVNYIYVTDSGGTATLTASTSLPTGAFAWVAKVHVPDATTWATTGAYVFQRYTESENDSRGQISHEREKLRAIGAVFESGLAPTLNITTNGGSEDTVHFEVATGTVYQLHRQTFPAITTGPYYYGNGTDGQIYDQEAVIDNANFFLLADGSAPSVGQRINLVLWGAVNVTTGLCKLFVNRPSGAYNSDANALADSNGTADYSVPLEFRSVAFMIARFCLRYTSASSGTWAEVGGAGGGTFDLRGTPVGIRTGGAMATVAAEFMDSVFRINDDGDETKQIAFQASGITTGTTRTITMPDSDVTLVTGVGSLSQFGSNQTTSAELASLLTDETGTGVVVYSISPTLQTPNLGTPSSGNLTNCTNYEGVNILSTGEVTGTKYLREDGDGTCSWQTVAGGGDVTKVGTPVDSQLGVWTGDGTIEGDADLTFDTSTNTLALAGVAGTSILAIGGANILVDSPRGTMTLSNIDALDATTEATIEAAIDTLANLTSAAALATVGTITSGTWTGTTIAIANGGTGQTTQTAAFDALAPTTTKGDVIVSNGTDNIRLAVGTNDQVLTADSTQASGVKWAAAGGGGGGLTHTTVGSGSQDVTVTDQSTYTDFSATNGNHYFINMPQCHTIDTTDGNCVANLPTPTAGHRIGFTIQHQSGVAGAFATAPGFCLELNPGANEINGASYTEKTTGGGEKYSLWLEGETIVLQADGSGWFVERDGRIAHKGYGWLSTDTTTGGSLAWPDSTWSNIAFDTVPAGETNNAGLSNSSPGTSTTGNWVWEIKRSGVYRVRGMVGSDNSEPDGNVVLMRVYDGTTESLTTVERAGAAGRSEVGSVGEMEVAAGADFRMQGYHSNGNTQMNGFSDRRCNTGITEVF